MTRYVENAKSTDRGTPAPTGTVSPAERTLRLRPCPSQKNTSEKAAFLLLVWCDFDSLVAALRAIAFLKTQRIFSYLFTLNSVVARSGIHASSTHVPESNLLFTKTTTNMTRSLQPLI